MRKLYLLICVFLTGMTYGQNALNFDGVDDFVQTNYPGVLGANDRTFEAWVYIPSTAPASNLAILDYGTNAVGSRNTFQVAADRSVRFISGGTNANINSTAGDVSEDVWVHIAFVLNSGTGFLYVNGVEVSTGLLTTVNTPSGNENMRIGERVTGGSILFNGNIDELRVWNVARTPSEIQNNWCDIPNPGAEPNLMAYYKFDQTSGTLLPDLAGTNDGTLINMNDADWVTGTCIDMTYVSSDVFQDPVTDLEICASYENILRLEVVTTGDLNPLNLTNIQLRTDGSTAPTIDIASIDIYYSGTSSTFSAANLFGSSGSAAPGVDVVINGSQDLANGTNYFWITYRIDWIATVGNVVDGQCNRITIDGSSVVPATTSPDGNRVLVDCNSWCPANATLFSETFDGPVIEGANGPVLFGNGGSNHNATYALSGTYFGWFNIQNGLSNVDLYDRRIEGFYFGCTATATFWARQSFGGLNIDVSIIDDNNMVLATQNIDLATTYVQYSLSFVPTTPGVRFHVFSSSTGSSGGVDLVMEDLFITQCCDNTFLPIELADYKAGCKNGTVKVEWTTVSESHIDYFTVERSRDGIHFDELGRISSSGNNSVLQAYQFSDNNASAGTSYYRMTVTDFDGKEEKFDVLPVKCRMEAEILAYPNPVFNEILVSFGKNQEQNYSVVLTNSLGQSVLEKVYLSGGETVRLDLDSSLSEGIYLLQVYSDHLLIHTQKLVKLAGVN